MRYIILGLLLTVCANFGWTQDNNPLESDEALRSRIKIKFALDPIVSKEDVTLEQQNGRLVLVGQVANAWIANQAIFLMDINPVASARIKNELIINNTPLSKTEKELLITSIANARLESSRKYKMLDIPLIGMDVAVNGDTITVSGSLSDKQKLNVKSVLLPIQSINIITFVDVDSDTSGNKSL
jgi:hypothetical protein